MGFHQFISIFRTLVYILSFFFSQAMPKLRIRVESHLIWFIHSWGLSDLCSEEWDWSISKASGLLSNTACKHLWLFLFTNKAVLKFLDITHCHLFVVFELSSLKLNPTLIYYLFYYQLEFHYQILPSLEIMNLLNCKQSVYSWIKQVNCNAVKY